MFGDLFGNIEQQQKDLQEKLRHIQVEASVEGGAIKVVATGNKEISNISIDTTALDVSDTEQLEDLLLEAVNRALSLAEAKASEATQGLMKDMLPPNMSGLFG